MIRSLAVVALFTCVSLSAQNIDILGGTSSCPVGANRAKANQIRVDTSVIVLDFEMWLDVPAADTLTFFAYRHHSRSGIGALEWQLPVQVGGGTGPGWYSTGPIALELTAGNYYALGVSWAGSNTYCYSTSGAAISFGEWQRAHTLTNPVPATLSFGGNDAARYYQRFTSVPVNNVVNVGTGCSSTATPPRVVAAGFFPINNTQTIDLADASANSIGVFALAAGATLPAPLPIFGCDVWLDTTTLATVPVITDATGYSNLMLPIPNNPSLAGSPYSTQALIFGSTIELSNAIDFVIN